MEKEELNNDSEVQSDNENNMRKFIDLFSDLINK